MGRSNNVKKNIIYSFILKIFGVGLTFLLLPLTIHYLTEIEYGIWVTLFSIMSWVNMLDMGIGLGVRNKLAEAVSKNNIIEIKGYISTGFFSILMIGILLLVIFIVSMQFIPVDCLFDTTSISRDVIYQSTLWTGVFVIISFILSIINQIYYAYQKAAYTGAINIMHSLVMLIIVYGLTLQENHSLLNFVFAFGMAVLLSRCYFIILFFRDKLELIPNICHISRKEFIGISSIGGRFFIIQLCTIVGFSFSDLLITKLVGVEYVRTYDVLFKIFNFLMVIQTLVLTPLWSAYTDAYVKKEYAWIKKTFLKTCKLSCLMTVSILILSLYVNDIIFFWLGISLSYDYRLLMYMVIYHIMIFFINDYCMLLNGIGEISVQMYGWIISAILIIPLSIFFVRYMSMKSEGVMLAMTLSMIILSVILPLNIRNIFRGWKKTSSNWKG